MAWEYERGGHRYKHRWSKDCAGFEPGRKGAVGKCPCHIDDKLARQILNQGVPFYDTEESPFPAVIYAFYDGVIYEAVPTNPGSSYHGYPWRGDLPGRLRPPRRIFRQLEAVAQKAGQLREYRKWMKKYGGLG
ncbi:hypothetical protein DaAHT2_1857 [Desulfurivibrio alkaliphilus AHT 2]|uniref:Uncharacterized protein n=1 Tax=Desulfurivibrio alkaliphilus (strain DSM 19089 / UNIQEM U267 / AHT2) TaxID=589865 RepID=D6Z4R3_DESAT|nr:hypothetical protein DaAHT2_1857 [Desulfurivibrio alkaliphilus AHT 2]